MAKYQKYAEYKDSGVEWLRELPNHWKASYVGVVSDVIDPQPDHRAPTISENGNGFPYIGIRDVNKDGTLNFETARPVEESAVVKQEQSFTIEPHNIIFCKVGTLGLPRKIIPHGRCALSATLVLIKAKKIESQFLLYALDSDCIISQTNFVATGSTRAALGIQQIRKFRIPLPSNSEQVAIACFLDHETAQIDTLIAKQEKLIELLKEKRQAVISHAVTKGLNPNVPMKDSGVEWLGEVPEHWEIIKFDYVIDTIGDIDHYMPSSVDVGVPYVMTGDLRDFVSDIDFENCKNVSYSDYKKLSKKIKTAKDDIIFARYATIGTLSYVDIDAEFLVSYSCVTIKPNPQRVTGKYLFYYLKSQAFLQAIQQQINSNTQGNVGVDSLRNVRILLPSVFEQERIIDVLKNDLIKMDNLIAKSRLAIQLMQERRTALISAAVTGKIDVRKWQKPNKNNVADTELSA
ncbi:restriction endonuclease subunit S [Acinetobacter gyllenbergii]|uniref:restriction endonuclease subunit S n=1 Tax=Acinetobacter gyllenbergii TaxID=134534 RepID=UPI0021CF238C|nr:restriction endonuclease subunit S [Acinetobacter gyllenbergii]MCU4579589.1 restriction endonuclease subunit S [Acinetobacter gyllenbergii]